MRHGQLQRDVPYDALNADGVEHAFSQVPVALGGIGVNCAGTARLGMEKASFVTVIDCAIDNGFLDVRLRVLDLEDVWILGLKIM